MRPQTVQRHRARRRPWGMHSKPLTRNEFLKLSAGLVAASVVPLTTACPTTETPGACESDPEEMISGNHGHRIDVTLADVADGEPMVYDIQGSSSHTHSVELTSQDFERLREGGQVMVTSSITEGHSHEITVRCG